MQKARIKLTNYVEFVNYEDLDNAKDNTVVIPRWAIQAVIEGNIKTIRNEDWLVNKHGSSKLDHETVILRLSDETLIAVGIDAFAELFEVVP